jgi:ribosomal protein S18 acetylase RimI-like enzyme
MRAVIFADEGLARRIESFEALVNSRSTEAWARHRDEPAALLRVGSGVAFFTGVGSPVTQAVGIGVGEPVSTQQLDEIEAFFFDRESAAMIHVTPWSDASMLAELGNRGYGIVEFNSVLLRTISSYDNDCTISDTTSVRVVTASDGLDAAASIAARAFSSEAMPSEELLKFVRPMYDAVGMSTYLAECNGIAAASATAYISAEHRLVGLFGAATLPEFRNRGLQSALIARRMSDAVKQGCDLAVVTTQPGSTSQRNMMRRAFELAYTKSALQRNYEKQDRRNDG